MHAPRMMDRSIRHGPFSIDEVAQLERRQAHPMLHPYTCCDHQTMIPHTIGLVCPKCDRIQTWVHAADVELPLPPETFWTAA